ncbi:helix-turn-helix domain-containing protein [Bacillus subtilis]|uniref:helix-turn-helix domain-containing protein n=1 Tax=Bacillus subtilis TaxID=1423 RepID=UPI000CD11001|nr:helix-turn-helix transcriptional regulator [Bacillus subtilis]AYK58538.1 XRE family transcriptional regulator [Bacillus subtilis subsp. subtilis]MEC0374090.1 helix-turn-helix transcriptional regulator [Bacillus subtilis]MEC0429924.1 helix-turn-helix transcriptional regulator [Bacillus subtilis]POD87788.1 Repressor LexA [Bacillus subtilis subsp. subtilis]WRK88431.1 helix-turn-helix transcriptional regulator [Bacillus subtilis]
MSPFGQQLRELRRARKLTVNQLAVYSGISSATISKIENGKRKPATIKKLAAVLKVPYENLMAAAGHIQAFPEEIREASESYQSVYEIYQTAVTRGAEHLPIFNSQKWEHLSKQDIENLSKYFDFLSSEAKKRASPS